MIEIGEKMEAMQAKCEHEFVNMANPEYEQCPMCFLQRKKPEKEIKNTFKESTVGELIKTLQKLDPNKEIRFEAELHENGYPITEVKETKDYYLIT